MPLPLRPEFEMDQPDFNPDEMVGFDAPALPAPVDPLEQGSCFDDRSLLELKEEIMQPESIDDVEVELRDRINLYKDEDEAIRQEVDRLKDQVKELDELVNSNDPNPEASLMMIVPEQINYTGAPELSLFASRRTAEVDALKPLGLKSEDVGEDPEKEFKENEKILDALYGNPREVEPIQTLETEAMNKRADSLDKLHPGPKGDSKRSPGSSREDIDAEYGAEDWRNKKLPQEKAALLKATATLKMYKQCILIVKAMGGDHEDLLEEMSLAEHELNNAVANGKPTEGLIQHLTNLRGKLDSYLSSQQMPAVSASWSALGKVASLKMAYKKAASEKDTKKEDDKEDDDE